MTVMGKGCEKVILPELQRPSGRCAGFLAVGGVWPCRSVPTSFEKQRVPPTTVCSAAPFLWAQVFLLLVFPQPRLPLT